ncbi:MAG: peptidoglycan recognition family protein [Planctomycetota bacterium]
MQSPSDWFIVFQGESASSGRRRPWGHRAAKLFLHAVILCLLSVLCLAGAYRIPRFHAKATPRTVDDSVLVDICDHSGTPDRDWKYIIIHHSATEGGSAAAFARFHVYQKNWDSLGYHFVIGNGGQTGDGEIEVGKRWRQQQAGSHARGYNQDGIGICVVGNFDKESPSAAQMRSLRGLILSLSRRYSISPDNVLGHEECEGAHTQCPGRSLSVRELRDWLRRRRDGA